MKIKRFTAANMQAGLKTISETLGPEAVILSNRKIAGGLEIVAGVDEHEFELYQAELPEETPESDIIKASGIAPDSLDKETMQQLFSAMSSKNKQAFNDVESTNSVTAKPAIKPQPSRQTAPVSRESFERLNDQPVERAIERAVEKPVVKTIDNSAISMLRHEIDGLKDLLREQTEQLKEPVLHASVTPQYERLEARLHVLGFTDSLIRKMLANYDRDEPLDLNWRRIMGRLASAISTPMYEPLSSGGVFAFTGPTGAGKTTTLAKLAAHAVKDYGSDSVAVISMDWFQVGGQEILRSVSDILGIEFKALTEKDNLMTVLKKLTKKRLVLIDTSGSSDALVHWNNLMLNEALAQKINTLMVIPATTHPSAINHFVLQHRNQAFTGAILSKLDESTCFGGVLEPLLKHRWPLWYCTHGQNIPQDIEVADARKLTKRLIAGLNPEKAELATAS
jgi:flagellar biosynthesis protein FlhF